jgi:hypothetical protein
MESWVYLFSKFTHEALLFEALILFLAFGAYAAFYITQKRKYGVAGNELPSNVVKAYLAQLMIDAEDMRVQLFGLLGKDTAQTALRSSVTGYSAQPNSPSVSMPPLPTENPQVAQQLKELEAKMTEQSKALDSLLGEKKRLEEELTQAKNTAPAATAASPTGGSAQDPALTEKVKTLEAQLAEYAIIEDDLANLKRLQKENKALRTQLETLAPQGTPAAAPAHELKTEVPPTEHKTENKAEQKTEQKAENAIKSAGAAPATESPTPELAPAAKERELVDDRAVADQNQSIVAAPPTTEGVVPTAELAATSNHTPGSQAPSKDDVTNFEALINDVEKSLAQNAAPAESTPVEPKMEAQAKSEAELQADFEKMLNS